MRRVAIVGGGFTGAAAAIRLSREATGPLEITVIEPRDRLGAGLAYDDADPDHRVNGPADLLVLFPDDRRAFADWFEASGGHARDPEALWRPSGVTYVRRSEVARWIGGLLAHEAAHSPSGARIRHLRDRATGLTRTETGWRVGLAGGGAAGAETVVLALAGQTPGLPRGVSAETAARPGFVRDPLDAAALAGLPAEASVLLIGVGLTAADVIATLARRGHRGPITAVSRRGLRPAPAGAPTDVAALLARLAEPMPRFLQRHGERLGLMAAFRALRADLAAATAEGRDLKAPFDDARDAASRLWPGFTEAEKGRFLRHLKPWYDTLRYRMVPQTGAVLARLEAAGRLRVRVARVAGVEAEGEGFRVRLVARGGPETAARFDAVVNCTGPRALDDDAFFAAVVRDGHARADPFGLGLEVDDLCRVLDAQGRAQADLRAYGLITRARFGDMTAIPQIALLLNRTLPDLAAAATGDATTGAQTGGTVGAGLG